MTAFKGLSRRSVLAAAGATTASLAGCFGSDDENGERPDGTDGVDTEGIESGGTFAIGLSRPVESLNPLTASSAPERALVDLLYQPGVLVEPEGFEAMPWIIADWDDRETADSFEIHFDVHEDLEWTDGEPFTVEDARFTYEYYIEHEPSRFSTAVGPMQAIGGSDAGYDLVLTLSETIGSYETEQLSVPLLPEHVWADVEHYADHHPDEPIGLGPGEVSADEGEGLAVDLVSEWPLAAQEWVDEHDRLLSGGPYLDWLRFPVFDGPNALHRAFLSGGIDAIYAPDFDVLHAGDIEHRDGVGLVGGEDDGVGLYTLNTRTSPLDDQAFRQALGMAMDRGYWADELKLGYAVPGTVVVPPAFEHLRPEAAAGESVGTAVEEGPDELRALRFRGTGGGEFDAAPVRGFLESGAVISGAAGTYAAADYPGNLTSFGRTAQTEAAYEYEYGEVRSSVLEAVDAERELYVDGQTIEERSDGPLTMLVAPHDERPLVSEFTRGYVDTLHELGVPIETEVRTASTVADRVYLDADFDIAPMDWSGFSAHGAATLYDLFHSDNAGENSDGFAYNASGYGFEGSAGADDAIDELRGERDAARRNELVGELAERLSLEAPVLVRSHDRPQWPVNTAEFAGFLSGIPGAGGSNLRLQALTVHRR